LGGDAGFSVPSGSVTGMNTRPSCIDIGRARFFAVRAPGTSSAAIGSVAGEPEIFYFPLNPPGACTRIAVNGILGVTAEAGLTNTEGAGLCHNLDSDRYMWLLPVPSTSASTASELWSIDPTGVEDAELLSTLSHGYAAGDYKGPYTSFGYSQSLGCLFLMQRYSSPIYIWPTRSSP
jgi:hypothetical protein